MGIYTTVRKQTIQNMINLAKNDIQYYSAMIEVYPDDDTFKPLKERAEERLNRHQKELANLENEN